MRLNGRFHTWSMRDVFLVKWTLVELEWGEEWIQCPVLKDLYRQEEYRATDGNYTNIMGAQVYKKYIKILLIQSNIISPMSRQKNPLFCV